ncbi:MAG: ferritin-like domain-containing protein [Sutterellaceae bacterium]|nr:ferritin-like domain-containing protein [Burkholderiaceae bacterium]MCX7901305.1 ferritin-like domain-containing protein [Burkholderiaceae bacterium]MDW8429001.1 ferritin-like domain-containing protein [Sutterellaceae bacterium]
MSEQQTAEVVTLRHAALAALRTCDPHAKLAAVRSLPSAPVGADEAIAEPPGVPGRPQRPILVPPQRVPRRGVHTRAGRAALLHALAHIEFNAINLALDAIWRFSGLPDEFYLDWRRVAQEEALHFEMLCERLRSYGHAYGDFPAHDGLWEMAAKTRGDLLARLALVPRTLEARGLDVAPVMRARLAAAGDADSAAVLDVILQDEIGHVAIGNRWFHFACLSQDPAAVHVRLAAAYNSPTPRGPVNVAARRAAGFTEKELQWLCRVPLGRAQP